MSCLVYGGSFAGLKSVQTRIITTGNTGRRIIMPIKQKYTRRFRKSIISTMVLMVTGAWKSIWNAEATLTVQLPFINIWIQSWDSIPLSAQRSLNMSTENRIKYSTINLIRISQQMKSTGMVYGLYISVPFESWGTLQLYHTRFARPKCGCQHYRPQDHQQSCHSNTPESIGIPTAHQRWPDFALRSGIAIYIKGIRWILRVSKCDTEYEQGRISVWQCTDGALL